MESENKQFQQNEYANNGGGYQGGGGRKFGGGEENLDRKVFVGGVSWDTNETDLHSYFSQFGEVSNVQIKYDQATGRSRGFAFVEFATLDACQASVKTRIHEIKGKRCEVKKATSPREFKKIFVGGISADFPDEDLKKYFSKYGEVDDVEFPVDKQTNRRRNFAFVLFADEASAENAVAQKKHLLGDRYCDVKLFQPNAPRTNQQAAGGPGGAPGAGDMAAYGDGYAGYGAQAGYPGAGGYPAGYDYQQYWQQYWQYYYGQYYNQYAQQAYGQGGQPGAQGGAPQAVGAAQQQAGYNWANYQQPQHQ